MTTSIDRSPNYGVPYWMNVPGMDNFPWLIENHPMLVAPCERVLRRGYYLVSFNDQTFTLVRRIEFDGDVLVVTADNARDGWFSGLRFVACPDVWYETQDPARGDRMWIHGFVLSPPDIKEGVEARQKADRAEFEGKLGNLMDDFARVVRGK